LVFYLEREITRLISTYSSYRIPNSMENISTAARMIYEQNYRYRYSEEEINKIYKTVCEEIDTKKENPKQSKYRFISK